MESTKIVLEKKDGIAKITMNRPEAVSWGRSLPPKGTVEAFTLVVNRFEGLPDPPYVICYIRLEGADTTSPHFLTGIDLSDAERARQEIKVGMPVRLVFKDKAQREGRMTDFRVEPA